MPSPEDPLTGACACGTVRFAVVAPFDTAGYCHCKRCQRRSGALWSENGFVSGDGFEITAGAAAVRTWVPPGGSPKAFCGECGGHVYAGNPDGPLVVVRLGALDGDPGIRPQWHAWVSSAPDWEPLPDDGLPRFAEHRT
jgi:hypothetical protein